jgi:putative hydrolases of HD superfamily
MQQLLNTALHAAYLKRTPRTGWQVRGAPLGGQAENVAAHSYGVVFLTMMLLDLDERAYDAELALRLAVLHDLPESLVGDLPAIVSRFIPKETKRKAERAALEEIVAGLPAAERYLALWAQYEEGTAPEARLVKDADKLDLMIQAYLYEQAGQRNLDEFWRNVSSDMFFSPPARAIFMELMVCREALYRPEIGGS